MISLRKRAYPTLVRAHVRGSTLQPGVAAELAAYFATRPADRACEAADHGYDPVSNPAKYLAEELSEPEHATLRTGPLTADRLHEWEAQEDAEHASCVQKDGDPGTSDVHVNVPLGSEPKKRKKKAAPVEPEITVGFVKADDEARVVYGIVLEPDVEDSQGDVVSKEDVERAAHRFLYQTCPIGIQHGEMAPDTVRPVESYIAPADFSMGGQVIKAGSWVLATHVPDQELWDKVKRDGFGAYSIGGTGRRVPLKP